jgi:hypothetical protein
MKSCVWRGGLEKGTLPSKGPITDPFPFHRKSLFFEKLKDSDPMYPNVTTEIIPI